MITRRQVCLVAGMLLIPESQAWGAGCSSHAGPLFVTVEPVPTDGQLSSSTLGVKVRNDSGKPVVGYVASIGFDRLRLNLSRFAVFAGRGGVPSYLVPGESKIVGRPISVTAGLPDSEYRCSIAMDLVLFADGSRWGPGKTPESARVAALVSDLDLPAQSSHGQARPVEPKIKKTQK
jgi:hypothetical protein